jgi:H-type lectin domain
MPDITAPRPVSGEPVATAWGQQVHDMLEGLQWGTASIVVSGASNGTAVVTFPRAYSAPPRVLLTCQSVSSNTQAHAWIASAGVTNTQVTVAAGRDDATTFSGTITVAWLAIGTPA